MAIGSSPRLRGTLLQRVLRRRTRRFIPAPAGNTIHAWQQRHSHCGSSPRLRGTQRVAAHRARNARFIPAPAGNTWVAEVVMRRRPGSSPRLRGTRARIQPVPGRPRFIPAPAGNTLLQTIVDRQRPVHPRACGEHVSEFRRQQARRGSSPRLRGTPKPADRSRGHQRFIPAPAGNTLQRAPQRLEATVHPRACGEHIIWRLAGFTSIGSSPRLRGTPFQPTAI